MRAPDIELTTEQREVLTELGRRFFLETEDVLAWAFALLTRYVDAGGEP